MPVQDTEVIQSIPKPNPRNNVTMFKIFQNVQFNVVQHKKYVKEMTKLYNKMDQDDFRISFSNALHYLFTFGDTSANVDRVIQFIANFCTSLNDEEEFLLFIFDVIFNCQCVSGQSVRYRASQLLAAVLAALGEDASLDDDLCDKLLASQMERLQDTRGAVRCRAALALQRLQNPADNDDEVTRAYRFHMSCDPSSSVRRAIVMSIAKSVRNVPFMMERLCDVDEAVRRAAFLYVSAINVTQLKVRQRVQTLKVGLNERCPRVRRVVEEILIPGWLSAFKGNIIDLLKAIRLDNSQDAKDSQYVAGKLLESLFKRLPTSELLEWLPTDKTLRLIPAEKLNKETAWYWRHLAEHLQKLDDDETLEAVLPDLVVLAGYIRTIVEAPCPSEVEDPVGFNTRQYVLGELASLLRVYDAGDPVGRGMLQKLITDVLTGDHGPLNSDVIRAFVAALEMVVPEECSRIELISSIISELREPTEPEQVEEPAAQPECTETKLQRARLRVSLNVAMEAQEEAVREQNYALAAECKAKVEDIQKKIEDLNSQIVPVQPKPMPTVRREKSSDTQTLKKCLLILNSALDTPQITSITPQLQLIYKEIEVELFENPDILETALETVALYAVLDKDFAKENKAFFFAHIIHTENDTLIEVILRCLVDILSVHGIKVFDPDENLESTRDSDAKKKRNRPLHDTNEFEGSISDSKLSLTPSHSTVIELLLQIMDGSNPAYRLIIAEGLCRLLMLGHLESPGILSRLLLLWFNPATEDEDMLRQTIGVFFQTFPVTVEGAQEQIQKATLPTLRALANAPAKSPISEIDQEAVIRFIVSLTRVNHEMEDSQGALGLLLGAWLSGGERSQELGLVCRTLSLLAPPRLERARGLAAALRRLLPNLPDKQSSRHLTRYLGALEALERSTMTKDSIDPMVTDSSLANGDLTPRASRATTSLPHPIARSTHVVINETVEEEVEIDESSPTDGAQNGFSEGRKSGNANETNAKSSNGRGSLDSAKSKSSLESAEDEPIVDEPPKQISRDRSDESSSSGVSPVKRPRAAKAAKKKLSLQRRRSDPKASTSKKSSTEKSPEETEEPPQEDKAGVKRTRSQRSLVDIDRAKSRGSSSQTSSSPDSSDANVTLRRKTRNTQQADDLETDAPTKGKKGGGKKAKGNKKTDAKTNTKATRSSRRSRSSASSNSMFETSADETELHTIVYEKEMEQSVLETSDDSESGSRPVPSGNVTIPETPDGSEDESESDSEPILEVRTRRKK